MISGVNHITLSVRDVDRSFGFYVETLGAKPLARWSKGVTGPQFADAAARIRASGRRSGRTTGAKAPRSIFSS
jgi:catechol 2,3-dioxygenase-like lactoylglutathione lyase family enzyme